MGAEASLEQVEEWVGGKEKQPIAQASPLTWLLMEEPEGMSWKRRTWGEERLCTSWENPKEASGGSLDWQEEKRPTV